MEETRITNTLYFLVSKISAITQDTNQDNRSFLLKSSLSLLVSKREGSLKSFRISLVAFLFLYFFLFQNESAVFVIVPEFDHS